MKVIKFGGSSLADAGQIRKVCDIVIGDPQRRFVVVSAPGKGKNDPVKVTDMLIAAAGARLTQGEAAGRAAMQQVIDRYAGIAAELGVSDCMPEIAADFTRRIEGDTEYSTRFTDVLKAGGEDNSARLVAAYLRKLGCDAAYVNPGKAGMLMSDEFGSAQILPEAYALLARNLSGRKGITVFPGFFGVTKTGETVTFPRGGSDITGAILAAALEADVYENFTDVDYVYSANPRQIEHPKPIPLVTYREMRELSYAGFNVYQEEALLPVYRLGIPVNIRNANNPACPGTMIVAERAGAHRDVQVAGIACDKGFSSVYVSKYLMNREIGFGRKVLGILEDEGISYEHTPTGIDDITVIVRSAYLQHGVQQRVTDRIKNELGADDVTVQDGLSLVVVVGEGMKHAVGIAAKAAAALSDAGVNISMISQGSSEVSMIFAVDTQDATKGVQALYDALM